MGSGVFYFCSVLLASPFLAIVGILACHQVRQSVWKREKRNGKRVLGFCPPSVALATAFLLARFLVVGGAFDLSPKALLLADALELLERALDGVAFADNDLSQKFSPRFRVE